MSPFDRLIESVEDLTEQAPRFEDDSDVFEADVSVMVVEDDTRYLAVPMPTSLTPDTVGEILEYVDGEWNGHWQKVQA